MFKSILHANDGSAPAFKALSFAIEIAKQNRSELHMVSVEEISYAPESIEEIREEKGTSARRFHNVIHRASAMAEDQRIRLVTHVFAGHPVRDIVALADDLGSDLLVIGATGHSGFYERIIGSRADRMIQLAPCPVLVIK